MKVFIYQKAGSKKMVEIEDAMIVIEKKNKSELKIFTKGSEFKFDTKKYKAVIYQN